MRGLYLYGGKFAFQNRLGYVASQLEGNLPFWLCFTLYLRAISKYKLAPGGLYMEGRFNGRLFALQVWGTYVWSGVQMEGLIFGILRY